jgi:hypothetical protein
MERGGICILGGRGGVGVCRRYDLSSVWSGRDILQGWFYRWFCVSVDFFHLIFFFSSLSGLYLVYLVTCGTVEEFLAGTGDGLLFFFPLGNDRQAGRQGDDTHSLYIVNEV